MNTRRTGRSSQSIAVQRQKRPPRRRLEASLTLGPVRIQRTAVRGSGWYPAKLLSLWLIGLLVGLLYVFMTFDNFYAFGAEVSGTQLLAAEDIYNQAGLEGHSIFWLNQANAEVAIEQASPYVSAARVRFRVPGRIRIDVTERMPAIMWQTAQGTAWVDRTGVALPPLARGPDAPLLQLLDTRGEAIEPATGSPVLGPGGLPVVHLQAPLVTALLRLQELLPDMLTYQYDAQNGLNYRSRQGTQVIFGVRGDLQAKLEVLRAIEAEWQKRGQVPAVIDLRVDDRPFVR